MVVNLPDDFRSGQHQPARIRAHLVAVLADSPLHEKTVAEDVRIVGKELAPHVFRLLQAGKGMVGDLPSLFSRRPDLDSPYPARFGESAVGDRSPPGV